jgi:diacylglycerol kinase (CTP)
LVSILETPPYKYKPKLQRVIVKQERLGILELLMQDKPATAVPSPAWRLRLRNDLHLARKTWHCGMGVFMALFYGVGFPKAVCVSILIIALAFFLTAEYARLRFPKLNAYAIKAMGPVMRKHEIDKMSGTPFYIGSVLLAIVIFPKSIAILSILFLAIGDPMSSIFGLTWGHKSYRFANGKSLIGTAAGMGVCSLITFLYLMFTGVTLFPSLCIALAAGLAGGGAEMIPLEIDDNFSIPLVSGLALWISFVIFGV